MRARSRTALYIGFALAVILGLCWLAYAPGLHGGFLFDDFGNLDALGNDGPIHDWASLLRYITSGIADPIGRPLTLLSFLIDAQDWPADPFPFKRTSLLLHLLNGVLLFQAGKSLLQQSGTTAKYDIRLVAGFSAALWVLHPLWVSTVLYVVQREAMLPVTWTLCGLIAWCHGRELLYKNRRLAAIAWMVTGAWLCTLLAVLCKANGALLPLLIAVSECTVLRTDRPSRALRSIRRVLLGVPIALLFAYLAYSIPAFEQSAAENRPWTILQRLLSEPRFLVDYLRLLFIPRATSFGIFNDQVQASSSAISPWTTLPCLIAVIAACGGAWWARRRLPLVAFAVLFFFAGHLLESTFPPLELAFEHRNYLPALFIFLPLACGLSDERHRTLRLFGAACLVCVLCALTFERASVWGNRHEQALIWARINPDSPRAQALAASIELERGQGREAVERLRMAMAKSPQDLQITLNLAQTECQLGALSDSTWAAVLRSLAETKSDARRSFDWFVSAVDDARSHRCTGLTLERLRDALAMARSNPKFGHQLGRRQDYSHIEGLIALAEHDGNHALEAFDQAVLESPNRGIGLLQTGLLASAGFKELALRHLEFVTHQPITSHIGMGMPKIHAWILQRQRFWEIETEALRKTLTDELQNSPHDEA